MLYTLESIREKYILSSLLGLVGGPLSYSAGVGIGSITILTTYSYIYLAIAWALIVPLLFKYANNQD